MLEEQEIQLQSIEFLNKRNKEILEIPTLHYTRDIFKVQTEDEILIEGEYHIQQNQVETESKNYTRFIENEENTLYTAENHNYSVKDKKYFNESFIENIHFINCIFSQNFEDVYFRNCTFSQCNINASSFQRVTFHFCTIDNIENGYKNCNFLNSTFTKNEEERFLNVNNTFFIESYFLSAMFIDNTYLNDVKFYDCYFGNEFDFETDTSKINFHRNILDKVQFDNCEIYSLKFTDNIWFQVNFENCTLVRNVFDNIKFRLGIEEHIDTECQFIVNNKHNNRNPDNNRNPSYNLYHFNTFIDCDMKFLIIENIDLQGSAFRKCEMPMFIYRSKFIACSLLDSFFFDNREHPNFGNLLNNLPYFDHNETDENENYLLKDNMGNPITQTTPPQILQNVFNNLSQTGFIRHADFRGAIFTNTKFINIEMYNVMFSHQHTDLQYCSFFNCLMIGCIFSHNQAIMLQTETPLDMKNVYFQSCRFLNCLMKNTLTNITFVECNMNLLEMEDNTLFTNQSSFLNSNPVIIRGNNTVLPRSDFQYNSNMNQQIYTQEIINSGDIMEEDERQIEYILQQMSRFIVANFDNTYVLKETTITPSGKTFPPAADDTYSVVDVIDGEISLEPSWFSNQENATKRIIITQGEQYWFPHIIDIEVLQQIRNEIFSENGYESEYLKYIFFICNSESDDLDDEKIKNKIMYGHQGRGIDQQLAYLNLAVLGIPGYFLPIIEIFSLLNTPPLPNTEDDTMQDEEELALETEVKRLFIIEENDSSKSNDGFPVLSFNFHINYDGARCEKQSFIKGNIAYYHNTRNMFGALTPSISRSNSATSVAENTGFLPINPQQYSNTQSYNADQSEDMLDTSAVEMSDEEDDNLIGGKKNKKNKTKKSKKTNTKNNKTKRKNKK